MIRQNKHKDNKQFGQAEKGFQAIFPADSSSAIQLYTPHRFYQRIFSPLVLIWCLIFQRLRADHTCDEVVANVRAGAFDHLDLREGKAPLSKRLKSQSNSSFCQARKRLPVEILENALHASADRMRQEVEPVLKAFQGAVYLLDGTTLRLRPYPELVSAFGQHATIRKVSYWVIIRMVTVFCLYSGGLSAVQIGSLHEGELKLGKACLRKQKGGDLYIADRGLGVFSLLQAIRDLRSDAIVRLSRPRAKKLFPYQLYPGNDLAVVWAPSKKDTTRDRHLSLEPIEGRLIYTRLERPGFRSQDLYLFTTLLDREAFPRETIIQVYGLRWQVELNLRYVKSTLQLKQLEAKSVDMVSKEVYAGLLAYNMIRMGMLMAARQAGCLPLQLSLTQSLRRICTFLFEELPQATHPRLEMAEFIRSLSGCTGSRHRKERVEPRWVRPRDKIYPEFWSDRSSAKWRYVTQRRRAARI